MSDFIVGIGVGIMINNVIDLDLWKSHRLLNAFSLTSAILTTLTVIILHRA